MERLRSALARAAGVASANVVYAKEREKAYSFWDASASKSGDLPAGVGTADVVYAQGQKDPSSFWDAGDSGGCELTGYILVAPPDAPETRARLEESWSAQVAQQGLRPALGMSMWVDKVP